MESDKQIYALGVGHNTPVFIDLAEACGYRVVGLYHYNADRTGDVDHGFDILGSFDDLFSKGDLSGMNFLLTMGDNKIRTQLSDKIISFGGNVPTLIHPMAVISRFSEISPVGVYISPFTYVQADSIIGRNTILLSHVNISHTTTIGNSCFIAGGVTIGAYTTVDDFVFVGQGALSISGKVSHIGREAYIGARCLVTHDVPEGVVFSGTPGRVLRKK
jgi:UDP-perosamine 4-acetyltransferase